MSFLCGNKEHSQVEMVNLGWKQNYFENSLTYIFLFFSGNMLRLQREIRRTCMLLLRKKGSFIFTNFVNFYKKNESHYFCLQIMLCNVSKETSFGKS